VTELAAIRPGLGVWLMAARPRTLSAAVSPVLVGTAIAHRVGALRPAAAALALLASLLIQVGTNFANDYSDFRHGADADRVGPTRVTQSGLVPPGTVKLAAWFAFGISGLFGIALAAMSGWPILVIGLASVAAGWLYTGGPWPLGYHGLGDVFVMAFFGFAAVGLLAPVAFRCLFLDGDFVDTELLGVEVLAATFLGAPSFELPFSRSTAGSIRAVPAPGANTLSRPSLHRTRY